MAMDSLFLIFLFSHFLVIQTVREPQLIERQTLRDFCSLPPEHGPCQGSFPQIYFDSATSTCKLFNYGGCGGNKNRFQNFAICHETCSTHRLTVKRLKPFSGTRIYHVKNAEPTSSTPEPEVITLEPEYEPDSVVIVDKNRELHLKGSRVYANRRSPSRG